MNHSKIHNQIRWITETALMLALLIVLQWLTKPVGQILTGSCVNAVLAVTVLLCGISSGVTVALISPVLAYLFGIAPQILTVPAIMVGNVAFVLVLRLAGGGNKQLWYAPLTLLVAALTKFLLLFVLVKYGICGILAQDLMELGWLKKPMLAALPTAFGVMQLVTALIGGAVALFIVPMLKKARKRN